MHRVKQIVAAVLISAFVIGAGALPALAQNDSTVPADTCSNQNPNVVGTPAKDQNDGGEPNAVDQGPAFDPFGSPVAAPVSDFNAADLAQGFPSEQAVLVTDGAQGNRSGADAKCSR